MRSRILHGHTRTTWSLSRLQFQEPPSKAGPGGPRKSINLRVTPQTTFCHHPAFHYTFTRRGEKASLHFPFDNWVNFHQCKHTATIPCRSCKVKHVLLSTMSGGPCDYIFFLHSIDCWSLAFFCHFKDCVEFKESELHKIHMWTTLTLGTWPGTAPASSQVPSPEEPD